MRNIVGSAGKLWRTPGRPSVLTLVAAFVLSWGTTAAAQVVPDPSSGLMWTSVNNCPQANTFGPQVYSDVLADEPNAEEELVQLNGMLVRCQQAAVSYSGPSAADTFAPVLQTVSALAQQWYIMRQGLVAASVYPQSAFRTAIPARQIRYAQASVSRYIPPRAPVLVPRLLIMLLRR